MGETRDRLLATRDELVVDERQAQSALIAASERTRASSNRATAAEARSEATESRANSYRDRAARTAGPTEPQIVGAQAVGAPNVGSGAAILVVDDSSRKRVAIRAMLAPLGHAIVEVASGRAALRALESQTFAIILMDVRMPTLSGFETAKLCREHSRGAHTPIIFVTAYGDDEKATASAYASGGVDFISMPVLPSVLQAKVTAFVGPFIRSQELERSLESMTAVLPPLTARS